MTPLTPGAIVCVCGPWFDVVEVYTVKLFAKTRGRSVPQGNRTLRSVVDIITCLVYMF